jgi:hypothetical protein
VGQKPKAISTRIKKQIEKFNTAFVAKIKNEMHQKVINQNNRCLIHNKEFGLNNPLSLENVVLTCILCNVERSNRCYGTH